MTRHFLRGLHNSVSLLNAKAHYVGDLFGWDAENLFREWELPYVRRCETLPQLVEETLDRTSLSVLTTKYGARWLVEPTNLGAQAKGEDEEATPATEASTRLLPVLGSLKCSWSSEAQLLRLSLRFSKELPPKPEQKSWASQPKRQRSPKRKWPKIFN